MAAADVTPRETCEECGFDAADWGDGRGYEALTAVAAAWRSLFSAYSDDRLHTRPKPEVWSPVEYTVHTSAVVRFWREASATMLAGGTVTMDPEGYPDADRFPYNDTPAGDALDELDGEMRALRAAGEAMSQDERHARLRLVSPEWEAAYRESGVYDAETGLLHALHDAQHHLDDVRRDLERDEPAAPAS